MTQIQFFSADDRVSPTGGFALMRKGESADDIMTCRAWLDEADAQAFAECVEHSVGIGKGPLSHTPFCVLHFAGIPIEADPLA